MKHNYIFAALLLMMAGVQTIKAQKIIVTKSDDTKVEFDISDIKEVAFVEEADPHE